MCPPQRKAPAQPLPEDERVRLRPLAVGDASTHLAGCDEVIIEWLGGGQPSSRSQVEEWLETNARAWVAGGDVLDLGIEDIETSLLCGCSASSVAWST